MKENKMMRMVGRKVSVEQEGASEEYIGEGMVGGYTLSEDFIHMIRMTGTWNDGIFDER